MVDEEKTDAGYRQYAIEEYHAIEEPFYVPLTDEVELFDVAFEQQIPVLLKGPTGCGKTRFIEYMAWRLGRPLTTIRDATRRSPGSSGFFAMSASAPSSLVRASAFAGFGRSPALADGDASPVWAGRAACVRRGRGPT